MNMFHKNGLVLGGGGARAAYQAGVLEGIGDVLGKDFGAQPFQVITGISAGAINASFISSGTVSFSTQAEMLAHLWRELEPEQVLRTDLASLSRLSAGWIRDLSFGGMLGKSQSTHLLDTTPLRSLLAENISFEQIHHNVSQKNLHGVAITSTNYATGTAVTFFDSPDVSEWTRSSRIGQKRILEIDHVLASSSIPFIFKPVRVDKSFFGDGGIRSNTPFSPAIHLGADRILAIGVRYARSGAEVKELNVGVSMDTIVLSDIAGIMFNSLFLDAIEFDHERLQRINQTVRLLTEEMRVKHPSRLKIIPALLIQPSVDLGALAADQFHRFPRMLRHLLAGIGASRERGADLLSYIAFDKAYTSRLVEVGFHDAMKRKEEIRQFFEADLN